MLGCPGVPPSAATSPSTALLISGPASGCGCPKERAACHRLCCHRRLGSLHRSLLWSCVAFVHGQMPAWRKILRCRLCDELANHVGRRAMEGPGECLKFSRRHLIEEHPKLLVEVAGLMRSASHLTRAPTGREVIGSDPPHRLTQPRGHAHPMSRSRCHQWRPRPTNRAPPVCQPRGRSSPGVTSQPPSTRL
jgi:hypothetical protein